MPQDLHARALPAVEKFATAKEDDLYAELGKRLQMNRSDPATVADFSPPKEPEYEVLGLVSDLKAFGKNFFDRVNRQAYNLVCGADAEDSKDRENLVKAFSLGKSEVTAALAVLLVSQLTMAPAVAAVVAAIAVKLFYDSAHGAMCDLWKSKLPPAEPPK